MIPASMTAAPRWVVWQYESRDGKRTKILHDPRTGRRASSTDPETWTTYEEAARVREHYAGIGFVLGDGWIGVDWDHVRDAQTGEWAAGVLDEIQSLRTYAEISPSGTGAHAILLGDALPGKRSRAGDGPEFYASGRFFTVTGNHIDGTPEEVQTPPLGALEALYQRYIPAEEEHTRAPGPAPAAALGDDEIIKRATAAKNGEAFSRLFNGDCGGYPSQSEADAALCARLAFWTQDAGQIDRLFRRSGLYREKWDRDDYRNRTIGSAIVRVGETYTPGARPRGEGQPITNTVEGCDYRLTDAGNSERLVRLYGDVIRHCEDLKQWFVWDGRRWESDGTNRILGLATQTAKMIFHEAATSKNSQLVGKWALESEELKKRKSMVEGAKFMVPVRHAELDARPELFNCENGTLDLTSMEFREHQKRDLLTKNAGVRYEPEAQCPRWVEHLHTVFAGDDETIAAFQQVLGYSLLQYNPEQVVFILWGSGKNGKSETVKAIARIMGDYSVNIAAATLMASKNMEGGRARPDIVRLRGARFVTASEPAEGDVLSEELIKSLTGDHTVTARPLYGKDIEFKPGAKIFLSTNHKPKIRGREEGIWRRIWLFPFNVTIPADRRQRDYGDVLYEQEGPGIFAWMLAGLRQYLERGRLDQPPAVAAATAEYRIESNPVGRFIQERCVIDPRVRVGAADLFDGYRTWCEAVNWKPLTKIKFGEFVGTMFDKERDKVSRYWVGIRRKTEAEIENEDAIFETQSGLDDHTDRAVTRVTTSEQLFVSSRIRKVCPNLSSLSPGPCATKDPTHPGDPREAATHSTDPADYRPLPRPDFGQRCAVCGCQGVLHREKPADFNRRRGTAGLCAACFERLDAIPAPQGPSEEHAEEGAV